LKPKQAYEIVNNELKKKGFKIENMIGLNPYEKDHATILVSL
jgi:fibrillarin-like rRNA methylase